MGLTLGGRRFPARIWTPERADELIRTYNAEVRDELGLTPHDTREIDGL